MMETVGASRSRRKVINMSNRIITDAINDMIREAFSAGFRAGKEYQEYTGDNVPGDELDILIEDYCGEYMDTHFVS